jgi:PAS domain S-box-containing protein
MLNFTLDKSKESFNWISVQQNHCWLYGGMMSKIDPSLLKLKLKSAKEISEFAEDIIDTVREPLIVLDKDLRVVKASQSFYDFFKVTPGETIGTLIYNLGNNQWDIPKLRELLEKILPEKTTFDNFEVEHVFSTIGRRIMLLNARKIQRGSGKEQIILLAVEDITQRKLTEEALTISETRYRGLFESAKDGILILDSESGRIVDVNPILISMLGNSKEQFINKKFWEIGVFKDIVANQEDYLEFQQKGYNRYEHLPLETKDGCRIDIEFVSHSNIAHQQKVTQCNIRDITEQKQAEEAISSLAKFPSENPNPIVRISRDGRVLYANKASYAILPWKLEIGKSAPAVLQDIVTDIFTQKISKTTEMEYKKQIILVSAVPILESDYANLYISDITKRKQTEEKQRESEIRFKQVSENAKELIWEVDKNGLYTYASSVLKELLGYELEEIIGKKHFYDLFDQGNREELKQAVLGAFARKESFKDFVNINRHKDGREIILSTSCIPMLDSKGNLIGYRGVDIDITERKRAEEEVRESEERFRMVFENVFDGISIYNEDPDPSKRKLIECNERYSILAGRSRDELLQLGSTLGLQITLEDDANVNRLESIDKKTAYQGYFSWIRPDGKENVIEYVGVPITWRGKSYSISIDRDITERKRAEEALRESQSLYHSFIEQLPNAVFRKDREGRYILVNSQFCTLKGMKKEDFIGRKPMEVAINEFERQGGQGQATKYANIGKDIHEVIMRTGKLIEKEEEYPDMYGGKQFMQVVRMPVFDSYGTVIGTQGIMFDITERKQAEEEIVILVQSLRSVNECVSITDMEDKLIFVNQSFLNAYGYSEDELIGKQISMVRSLNNPPELIAEILSAALHGGWKGELRNKRKDGSEFLIYLSTTIINDKDGKPLGLIGVATDITERKRTEQELIDAKEKAESASKLKDAFIANISHEIRTPLNGILGMSSIIRDTFHDQMKEEDEVLFKGIDFSSKRIIRTVDMILNYSRLQVGEFPLFRKNLEISAICINLVTEYATAAKNKSVGLTFQNNCGDANLFADENSIIMAISNLIDNAIKYTNKGFINVILYRGGNDDIILDIKDTGIGIDQESLENIFEPYRQEQMGYGRAYDGLGLGLSLVKKVLTLNNASVFVESKKGDSTTFSINFGKGV